MKPASGGVPLPPVDVIAGADWSVHPAGRRMVIARHIGGGGGRERYRIEGPAPVGALDSLADRLTDHGRLRAWLGIDVPIGLPAAYLQAAGLQDFRAALAAFGQGLWADVYRPSDRPRLHRPFYPASRAPRGTHRKGVWLAGVGAGAAAFMRDFDRAMGGASLFWLIGPNQVGKATISAWRDLLAPAAPTLGLWPFDGPLSDCFAGAPLTVAEVYPALGYRLFGLAIAKPGARKGDPGARAACAPVLRRRCRLLAAGLAPETGALLDQGFESDDDFDAFIATLIMIAAGQGRIANQAPARTRQNRTEGWVLGLGPETG